MKKELKIWYCSENNFYYISYDGKEIVVIANIEPLSVDNLNTRMRPIYIDWSNSMTIQVEENKDVLIAQGDGINPDSMTITVGEDIYYLQITGDNPYIEYTGQKKTRFFAHKIWMHF